MKIVMIIFCLFPIIHYIHANIEAILFTEIENIITFHKTHELYVSYHYDELSRLTTHRV